MRLQTDIEGTTLKIILEDEGNLFDPRQISPSGHKDLPVEERPIGGLGGRLILKDVDEFHYERVEKWNRHIFVMTRPVET